MDFYTIRFAENAIVIWAKAYYNLRKILGQSGTDSGTGVYCMYRFTVMFENMPVANVCVSDDRKEVQIEKLVAYKTIIQR